MNSPLRFHAPVVSALRRFRSRASRWFAFAALLVFGALAMPQQALANSGLCNLMNQSASPVAVKEFNTVTVSYDIVDQGGCATSGMAYSISIINGTTSGSLTSPSATGLQFPGPHSISVQASASSGTFQIRINCTNDCSTFSQLTWNVTVENVGLAFSSPASGSASVGVGSPLTLETYWGSPSFPVPGDTVGWTVTSEPNTGDASLVPTSGATDTSGLASTQFTGATPGSYQVTATVSTGCTFCGPTSRTFDITVTTPDADTSVTIDDAPDPVGPTSSLTYTITAGNEGPDPASTVALTDVLPAGLVFTSLAAPPGWTCTTPSIGSNGTVSCTTGTLAVGAADVFTLVTSFGSTPAGGSVVTNAVSISAATGDINTSNQNASATTVVDDAYVLVANAPTTITVAQDETALMSVDYSVNGAAVTNNTGWVTSDPSNAFMSFGSVSGDGVSTTYQNGMTSSVPGTYTVTVSGGCSVTAPGCPPPDVNFTVIVEDMVLTATDPAGGTGSVLLNTPLNLEVTYAGPTQPAVDGTNFQWTIISEPSTGAGSLTFFGTQSSGGAGKTTNTFTGSVPGDYTISVCQSPDNCGPDTTTFTITVTDPSMTVSKSLTSNSDPDGSGSVTEGDVLTYQVDAVNDGSITLNNVVVGDNKVSPSSTTCTTLAVGATCSLVGTYTVTLADVQAGIISNTGTAASDEFGPIATSPVNTTVLPTVTLGIAKALTGNADGDGTGTVTAGDVLTYTVTATNTGNIDQNGVTVSDTLITPNSTSCSTVTPGSTCVLAGTYTVTAADASAGTISNTGSAASSQVSTPVTDTVVTPVTTDPSLSVAKIRDGVTDNDGSSSVTEGDAINYTITATNDGNVTLNNVVVSDSLLTPTSNACASVAVGATCVLVGSYVVTAADVTAGDVTNTASADSDESAAFSSNTVVTTVVGSPSLSVAKAFVSNADNDSSSSITEGDTLTYTLTATNDGNVPVTNVVVSDALITPTSNTCASVAVAATCVLTGTYTVTASDVTAGSVTNAGSADSDQTAPVASNTVVTPVAGSPSLSVAKVRDGVDDNDGSSSVTQGDSIEYTITATNDGNIPLSNVIVSDPLLIPTSNTCPSVAIGGTCVLTGSHVITAGDVSAGVVSNTATADSAEGVPTPSNTVNTSVVGSPALTVAKTFDGSTDADGSSSITEGDVLAYTVTMTNSGNVALTGVSVDDAQLTPASASCASVAVAATCVLSGTHTVSAADVAAGSVTNTATADSNETVAGNSNTVVTSVNGSPAIALAKTYDGYTDADGSVSETQGDTLQYTVTLTNTGNFAITGVTVDDAQLSPSNATCANVAVGATCVLSGTHLVSAADVAAGNVTNTASGDSSETAAASSNTVVTAIAASPALSVAKVRTGVADNDGSSSVTEGDAINYSVTATNSGNVALTNVVVSDAQITPASATCASVAVGGTCVLSGSHVITAADVSAGSVSNTASADSNESAPQSSNTVVTSVVGSPALGVAKTFDGFTDNDGSTTITEGDALDYTVTATNTGNVPLSAVLVSDGQLTPGSANCASLAVGAACVLSGSHVVTASEISAGNVTNTAGADSAETSPVSSNTVVTPVVGSPSLSLAKVRTGVTDNDGSTTVTQGDAINYTLTATNDGNIAVTNVVVGDPLLTPASTTCPSVAVGGTCVLSGSHVITAGEATAGNVTNTGTVDSSETNPASSNTVVTTVTNPGLAVAKTFDGYTDNDGSTSITQGDSLAYTVTATNTGNSALTNLVVGDPQLTPNSATCPSVAVGGTCVLAGTHAVSAGDVAAGNVTNTATADATETAPASSNTVVTAVVGSPAMTVAKVRTGITDNDGSSSVTQGDGINYTVTATNSGNVALTGVVVGDPLLAPGSATCASVAVGASCVLAGTHVITAADVAAGSVSNTGSADSNETAPQSSNTIVTSVVGSPALAVAKTFDGFTDNDGSTTLTLGDALDYTVTATNTGNVAITGVVVGDSLLTPASASCASVAIGGTCVLSGSHVVTAGDVSAGNVTNTGTADSNETAPQNSNTVVTPVAGTPALTVAKVRTGVVDNDASSSVTQGDTINYTVTATNSGTTALTGVVVSDPLLTPASTSCASVAIGGTCVLTGSHAITAGEAAAGNVTNTASADSSETAPATSNTVVTAVVNPGLALAKTFDGYADNDGSTTITQGDVLDYTVTATNTGNSALTNVVVGDPQLVPGSFTCASVATGASCVLSGTHAVSAADVAAGNVTNTATADSNETGPATSNTVVTAIVSSPALSVAKVRTGVSDNDGSGSVTQGDAINYTITATNSGNVALTNVVVSDPLIAPGSATCASVAVGGTCVLTGSHAITAGDVAAGTVSNTATADSSETAPATSNTVVTGINGTPGLAVAKTLDSFLDNDGSTTITQGDTLEYTVTATNTGNVPLTNLQVQDGQLTPGLATCASVPTGGTCILSGTHVVTAGDVATGSVTNTAQASANETGTTPSNTVVTTISGSPALAATKTFTGFTDNDGNGALTAGDTLAYTITAVNSGTLALTNVVVSDPQLTPASTTCASVAIGGNCTLSGSHVVTAAEASAGNVTNTASADSNETAPVSSNTVVTSVAGNPVLSITSGNGQFGLTSTVADDPLVVTLVDGSGNPLANKVITWTASGAGSVAPTSTTTNASGVAQVTLTFAAAAGPVSITASTGGGANPVTFTATAQSGGLGIASGDNQSGPINTTLPLPLKVVVIDPAPASKPGHVAAQALAGVPVTFTVTTGGGSVSQVVVATDANGEAATQFTLGPTPGAQSVTATIAGGGSVTFNATATVARTLAIVSGDGQSAAPGSTLPAPLVVHAQDNGADAAGVGIVWTVQSGTASIAASGPTSAAGLANAIVTLGTSAVPVTIRATRADDASVFVDFVVNSAQISDIPGLTPEEQDLAEVIDETCGTLAGLASLTPPQQDFLDRCEELQDGSVIDPGDVIDALDQLLPGLAAVMAEASFNAAQAQFQNLKARIAALRSGTQGSSFQGLAFQGAGGTVSLGGLGQALTQDADEPTPTPSGEVGGGFQRWGFFASGTIGRGEAEAGSTRPAYDYDINGLTVGLDYRKSDTFIFGGAVGYTRQDTELQGAPGQMDMSGWNLSGYATWYRDNSWYTDAVFTWGHNRFDLLRTITYTVPLPGGGSSSISQTARSDSDGDMLEGAFTFGRDFQAGGWSIGPYGRLLYTKLDFDEIHDEMESGPGSGLGLSIDARTLTSLASEIGAKFTYAHSTDWGVVTPHFQVEWEHEFKDDPKALTARFLADPNGTPFSLSGDEIDTDYFRLSLGMSLILTRGRSGFLLYEKTLGRDGFSQDNFGFGVRIEF